MCFAGPWSHIMRCQLPVDSAIQFHAFPLPYAYAHAQACILQLSRDLSPNLTADRARLDCWHQHYDEGYSSLLTNNGQSGVVVNSRCPKTAILHFFLLRNVLYCTFELENDLQASLLPLGPSGAGPRRGSTNGDRGDQQFGPQRRPR